MTAYAEGTLHIVCDLQSKPQLNGTTATITGSTGCRSSIRYITATIPRHGSAVGCCGQRA